MNPKFNTKLSFSGGSLSFYRFSVQFNVFIWSFHHSQQANIIEKTINSDTGLIRP